MAREIPMEKLAQVIGADLDQFSRAVTISLFSGVIRDTRVDTGRLRGNWQGSVDAPVSGTLDDLDPSGSATIDAMTGSVKGMAVNYLANNLPYAEVWNERDAIIDRNVARLDRNVREAARRNSR